MTLCWCGDGGGKTFGGGGMSKCLASGGRIPPVGKTLDRGSQGGYIIFLNNKYNSLVPLSWNSTRLWHVAHSTLAAETLAMSDTCDSAIFLSNLTEELTKSSKQTNITVLTDNQSLSEGLTKRGTSHQKLMQVLQSGCLPTRWSITYTVELNIKKLQKKNM